MWRTRGLAVISSRLGSRPALINSKSCSYMAASGFGIACGKREKSSPNTSCLEHTYSDLNIRIAVGTFSTVPGPPSKPPRKYQICSEPGCSISASFGWAAGKRETCAKHKRAGMVLLAARICKHQDGCRKFACFGFPGGGATHCGTHRLDDVKHYRCKELGCTSLSRVFDVPGGRGSYCSSSKKPRMVDVINRRCAEPNCESISRSYDVPGGKGLYVVNTKSRG